ncbi:laminin subunit beta-4 [Latimeria chalumnae]|uniref:laminin subunit beta-4 n=1 Tax=Latimeria chalumnae TaxID=7897 RepID=UPI00313B2D9E
MSHGIFCQEASSLTEMGLHIFFAIGITLLHFVHTQDECSYSSCHPVLGDLLIGRSAHLSASSTCGLNGPKKYCIIGYLEGEQKCFICDSRLPYNRLSNPYSHRIENVIATFGPDEKKKWWQSANGVHSVSIQLDLETLFQFSHLILRFKTFRPAAMLVERSTDYGRTWKVFRYFAQDCASTYPNIPTGQAQRVEDVICESRYSDIEPSTDGEVVLKALDPNFEIENPYSPHIQELITITNLRINFTKLHTLGDTLLGRGQNDPVEKYYYALYEMIVRGSCFCNGHASQCIPAENVRGDVFNVEGMVHGRCVCEHNTDGLNCERCKDFYNDVPWRPAEGSQVNGCRECNCNGHSTRCHFDMAVYQAGGSIRGGVCDDCQHNTMGINCDQCKPYFYQDPLRLITDPQACISCNCDPEGTLSDGMCQAHTDPSLGMIAGRCLCKENVEGMRCDRCRSGHFRLRADDPLGCQSCRCNPLGSVSSTCDAVTGECICQRLVTGRLCNQCFPEHWGLGSNLYGCSPCDCDIGGAHNNLCSSTDGQCECLPNIVGRQCNEPSPGYFFAPLDYYLYEAENAQPLGESASLVKPSILPNCDMFYRQRGYDFKVENGAILLHKLKKRSLRQRRQVERPIPLNQDSPVQVVFRERSTDKPTTWTGPGFARALDGAGLRFTINNIPYPMDFIIAIRYEPESSEDWKAVITVNPNGIPKSDHCRNKLPIQEVITVPLTAAVRLAIASTPVCLEPEMEYFIDIYVSQSSGSNLQSNSYILVDSLGLIPRIASLENFCRKTELEEFVKYECIEIASEVGSRTLPDVCEKLISSMSARIHNGAVQCRCNPQGSVSPICSKFGGQCQCKTNVIGRCCDTCTTGSYGFGPNGCSSCDCDPRGSISSICDQLTGQCACRSEIYGRRCDQCQPGYFGFPNCRPCQCNGFAELCDPQTGVCLNCRGFTTGNNCERCIDGYYGTPLLRQPCRPCLCPDTPDSGRYFAYSCYQDPRNQELICNCLEGYTGTHCNKCPAGSYGALQRPGDKCSPCPCSNNIEKADPNACNTITGECLKCLYNTYGPNCQYCKPGYFGSALNQDCRRCACNPLGTDPRSCPTSYEACECDQVTGQCPCLPNVIGTNCGQCDSGYWNLDSGNGCQNCDCDPQNSLSNQCNQFTGQCPCRLGYGGRRCDECQENFFGNPQFECISCNCDLQGTQRPVCDKNTGICNCKVGVTGKLCDECARGFQQEFPVCTRCHPCFDQWDTELGSISITLEKLIMLNSSLQDGKLQPNYDKQLKQLEDKLDKIQTILNSPFLSVDEFQNVKEYFDNIRKKAEQINLSLNPVTALPMLKKTIAEISNETDRLHEFHDEFQKNLSLHKLNNYSSTLGSYKDIRKSYEKSLAAEKKVNGTDPFIINSKDKRNKTIALLNNITVLRNNESPEKLKKKVKSLDVVKLNNILCGEPGNLSCSEAICGGALCRNDDGSRKCGGLNCTGALSLAKNVFDRTVHTDTLIRNLTRELRDSENQIDEVKRIAEDAKNKASNLSDKIAQIKDYYEKEKEQTKALIMNVKTFLTDTGIPPEDIEKVANYVLSIQPPKTPEQLNDLLKQIKAFMSKCDEYENDINKLKKQAEEAEKLLKKANETQIAAANLPDLEELKNNLENAEKTQGKVRSALNKTLNDLEDVNVKISKTNDTVEQINDKLMDLNNTLYDLNQKIDNVKNKTEMNRQQAEEAKEAAEAAQANATEANALLANVTSLYKTLKEQLKGKGEPKDAIKKAKDLQTEAEELLKNITKKTKRLSELEQKITHLNKAKEDKAKQIEALENQVIEIKKNITSATERYATCTP